jgi:hypothetical protein
MRLHHDVRPRTFRAERVDGKSADQGNRTLMPRHPSQEIQTGTYYAILKKLGIKE